MTTHPVVAATVRRHLADAELRLALLESRREEVPATRGAALQASRISRQITQARAIHASWAALAKEL